jgi:hypothetical protein
VGAILYHLTFLITDLITEFYGKDKASFCIKLGIAINIFVAITIACMDYLEATSWSKIDNILFHKVFGFFSVSFLGSIIACYISKKLSAELFNQNVTLITKIKKKMKNCLMDINDKMMLMKRSFIETIFSSIKLLGTLIHHRHRSPVNPFTHLFAGLISYQIRDDKPSLDQLLKLNP